MSGCDMKTSALVERKEPGATKYPLLSYQTTGKELADIRDPGQSSGTSTLGLGHYS